MPKDYNKEFEHYFNIIDKFRDHLVTYFTGKYSFDILRFEKWLQEVHGYNPESNISMKDFVREKFGQDAVDFIYSIL